MSNSPIIQLLLPIIDNPPRNCVLGSVAAAADVIAADARLDEWFAIDGKATLTDDEAMEFLEKSEAQLDRCSAAVASLQSGGSPEEFHKELTEIAAELSALLPSGVRRPRI